MRTLLLYLLMVLIAASSFAASPDSMNHDLLEVTVPQLEQMYRNHKYTVTEVVHWYMARIEKYNGIYRAIQNVDTAGALATAAREDAEARPAAISAAHCGGFPSSPRPIPSIKGLITTDGWQGYMIPGHELIAPKDATIVAKLRAAGAIILGQTNMPDFAASDTNRSTAYGRTGNAYDVRFSPGGSSGGTVTAITSNFAVLGNGTDTGNSIRMPAATSSVVGVFPTRGLVSIAGIAPLDWLLDNTGPIARDVTDATIALDVMAGEDPLDPRTVGSAAKAQPGPYTALPERRTRSKENASAFPLSFWREQASPFRAFRRRSRRTWRQPIERRRSASPLAGNARGLHEGTRRAARRWGDRRLRRFHSARQLRGNSLAHMHSCLTSAKERKSFWPSMVRRNITRSTSTRKPSALLCRIKSSAARTTITSGQR